MVKKTKKILKQRYNKIVRTKEQSSKEEVMRFSIIDREPFFDSVRDNLEKLVKDASWDENRMYQPLTEIRENEKNYNVKLQMPGMNKEDIQIEMENNTLCVKAEKKMEEAKENENIHFSEFSYGQFIKTIEFAKEIDVENSESEYKDGILTITLHKKEEKQKEEIKKISVK